MQISEALKEVSKAYIPGVIEFYSNFKRDPWQAAHDRYEGVLVLYQGKSDYFERMSDAAKEFTKECKSLIDTYKATHPEQPDLLSAADAFVIADPERVKFLDSMTRQACLSCGSTENVRLAKREKDGFKLFCHGCVP